MILNHVAFLVRSVDRSARPFARRGCPVGPAQIFDGEGTREIYIGDVDRERSLILLMEPVAEGSYRRALAKRGPGLHHMAVDVADLGAAVDIAGRKGWVVHPSASAPDKTAWLRRPGFPGFIELQERDDMRVRRAFATSLWIPASEEILSPFASAEIRSGPELTITIGAGTIKLEEILGGTP